VLGLSSFGGWLLRTSGNQTRDDIIEVWRSREIPDSICGGDVDYLALECFTHL
jgi:hypothetical protein